jgi:type IV secretory pathway protease TraF
LELLRAKKIRRLRVAVSIAGAAFVGLLAIIIYLSTGGIVHPTQGVTTEWGTASQVNTLVDKMATPRAGNHVIIQLPGNANKDALVLGFLQGFDGVDYLVTVGADTIIVPREDFVGTVTAIWPSLF